MSNKNTRIVYTDEMNLNIYRSLPDKDFKEFMMAYLTYKKGDDIEGMFTSLLAKTLFMTYISKIEYNESKWEKRAKANQENGKKGGRPRTSNNTQTENKIEVNTEFEITPNEPVKTEEYPNPQPKIESPSEGQEMGKNEVMETKNETVRETDEKLDWMMDVDEVGYRPINLEKHPELDFLREDDDEPKKEQEKEKWMEKFEGVIYGSVEYYKLLNSIIEEYPSVTRDSMIRKVENHYKSMEAA